MPLAEACGRGPGQWTARREAYANNQNPVLSLVAVITQSNRSKAPSAADIRCRYAA